MESNLDEPLLFKQWLNLLRIYGHFLTRTLGGFFYLLGYTGCASTRFIWGLNKGPNKGPNKARGVLKVVLKA